MDCKVTKSWLEGGELSSFLSVKISCNFHFAKYGGDITSSFLSLCTEKLFFQYKMREPHGLSHLHIK